ncbi:response regulator transcription factor [Anaeroselena agilis]|uniref:Response regulator transcription factor n=1 Tax=Anaeroselena agilis TaxID=3063788 RepID=A0ABU3P0I7_9FIRM|nr:response regulator transcription factor [Selenomonadales bacterium 4137-cl]
MRKAILIADDEQRMRKLIADYLLREGYTVIEAGDGRDAIEKFRRDKVDLAILDVMMPGYDGWTVCREIRKLSGIPVIMLTAKGEEVDQLFGFEIGADEYITKPFSPRVLTARVNAIFRRAGDENARQLSCDGLEIDPDARVVTVDGCRLEFSPKEYELLVYLAGNKGRALSREQILNSVWDYDYFGDLRTVDTHINRVRTKIGTRSHLIQTIRGYGYRFGGEQ